MAPCIDRAGAAHPCRAGAPLPLLLLLLLLGAAACSGNGYDRDLPGSARTWIEGPVRWLVLPEEARQFRRLDSSVEVLGFIEEFWRRRDPDPQTPGNPFSQTFFERVQSADLLYDAERNRGSMTDRGRATIVLGPPSIIRSTQKAVPSWQPDPGRGRSSVGSRRTRVEVWGYVPADLPPRAVEMLVDEGYEFPVEIMFVVGEDATHLVEGEEVLEITARSAVRE